MILAVSEKGKKKDHRIILDRLFTRNLKRYRYAEMQVSIADRAEEDREEKLNRKKFPIFRNRKKISTPC